MLGRSAGSLPAPSVRRLDDGRFEVRYTPMVSLPLLLQLAVRRGAGPDEPIGASPFAVDVAPGEDTSRVIADIAWDAVRVFKIDWHKAGTRTT